MGLLAIIALLIFLFTQFALVQCPPSSFTYLYLYFSSSELSKITLISEDDCIVDTVEKSQFRALGHCDLRKHLVSTLGKNHFGLYPVWETIHFF